MTIINQKPNLKQKLIPIISISVFMILCMNDNAFAQFTQFKEKGKDILKNTFDLVKWIGLALGIIYGGVNGLKLFSDREEKIDVIKKIIWIPFAIIIIFFIPDLIKLVTGQNPLE